MSVPILHYPFSIFHLGNDGLLDGYEVQNGTDPLNPDTDNDDIPDGWSLEQYAAHRLLNGEEGDRTITITLQASTPASNRAVLRIGDLPILLGEANTWAFSIPTGTVWNVELRTDGLPVQLALETGAGVFTENVESIFASVIADEGPDVPQRSAPPSRQSSSGGSRGGSGSISAPVMVLSPALQVVHEGEVALVTVMCSPQTPAVSNMLHWTFEPDYMSEHVYVADDKMSATVSGLDAEWHSSVTLRAAVGANPPAGLSTSAIVYFCNGHGNPTNQVSFPPNHTNMTINPVYRDCGHPFGDDEENPEFYLEIEAGRETASGWQHLA